MKQVGYVGVADRHENKLTCREDGNDLNENKYPIATISNSFLNR
jgi:hypothetical protein